ncbi:MAG: serine/threonine protein phosphatase, partial [Clostridia bacterium]|nr:serine/threonine protein phosphatase [Clostridia bacterium]
EFEDTAICGTRGWWYKEGRTEEDEKILDRERKRLVLALEEAVKLKKERIVVGLHYPPLDKDSANRDFFEIMKQYNVDTCVYGHLHSFSHKNAVVGEVEGINLKLVAGDFVNFMPVLV